MPVTGRAARAMPSPPSQSEPPSLHVVLVAPEIPWNTGNAGRTCLAVGAQLHLVQPLGFSLDERAVRRAGLDYWARVVPNLHLWPSWAALEARLAATGAVPHPQSPPPATPMPDQMPPGNDFA